MGENLPMIITWNGKPLEDCTREELIEAARYLNKQLEQERKMHKTTREIHSLAFERLAPNVQS